MADANAQADTAADLDGAPGAGGADEGSARRSFRPTLHALRPGGRDLWQVPVLLGAVALLIGGLSMWIGSAPGHDYPGALDSVEAMIERQEYDRAMAMLNGPIREHIGDEGVAPETLTRFYVLRADALYLAQKQQGLDVDANNTRIIENYEAARSRSGAPLPPMQVARLSNTLVSLGRVPDALREIAKIGDTSPELRHDLFKRIIELGLKRDATASQRSLASDLLAQLRGDPGASDATRFWTVIRLTRMSLASGNPEDAVRRLLPEMQRIDSRLDPQAAEMFALLGRAYIELGLFEEARSHLSHAESIAESSSDAAARIQILLAQLDRQGQDSERARDRFAGVVERYPQSPVVPLALVGLGELEADLGNHDRSLEAYATLVGAIREGATDEVGAEQADESIDQRFRERFERGDYETALKYATLIEEAYRGEKEPPASVALRLAQTHRRLAESLLEGVARMPDGSLDVDRVDPPTLEQARVHFARAGDLYRRHARQTLLSDAEMSADSLWLAADSLDNAGDLEGAAELFAEYVDVRHDDPRKVEGEYRLAKTFQARGDYGTAAKSYEKILAEHPASEEAYASYVPLAQCYLYDPAASNADRAEDLLRFVISGDVFEPNAPEFRSSLLELGRLYMHVGRHEEAIRRLGEALGRYPDLEGDARFTSRLADAYRLSATSIGDDLRLAMPQSQRFELQSLCEEHLASALELYEKVVDLYQQRDPRGLGDLDRVLVRNALFYRGDCAFDLGERLAETPERARTYFERAIRYYDASAQRYAEDPASLVAMIQIVNCYAALGKWREVQTAHERARARLGELPQSAWESNHSPMDRRYWERWLEASVELDRLRQADAG